MSIWECIGPVISLFPAFTVCMFCFSNTAVALLVLVMYYFLSVRFPMFFSVVNLIFWVVGFVLCFVGFRAWLVPYILAFAVLEWH